MPTRSRSSGRTRCGIACSIISAASTSIWTAGPIGRLDPLLAGKTCVLGLEPEGHVRLYRRPRIVGNAIMAAIPGHPFLETVIRRLPEFSGRPGALLSTGPFMLSEVYEAFDAPESVHLAPPEQLSPLTLEQADRYLALGHCEVDVSAAYAVHFHHGTWWRALSPTRPEPGRPKEPP